MLDGAFIDRDLGNEIFSLLPPLGEAVRLCELYLEHGKYMCVTTPVLSIRY